MGGCGVTPALAVSPEKRAGRAAYHGGLPVTANPHPVDAVDHQDWRQGWQQGEAEWASAWRSSWPDDMGL